MWESLMNERIHVDIPPLKSKGGWRSNPFWKVRREEQLFIALNTFICANSFFLSAPLSDRTPPTHRANNKPCYPILFPCSRCSRTPRCSSKGNTKAPQLLRRSWNISHFIFNSIRGISSMTALFYPFLIQFETRISSIAETFSPYPPTSPLGAFRQEHRSPWRIRRIPGHFVRAENPATGKKLGKSRQAARRRHFLDISSPEFAQPRSPFS